MLIFVIQNQSRKIESNPEHCSWEDNLISLLFIFIFQLLMLQLVNTLSNSFSSLLSEFKRSGNNVLSLCSLTSNIKDVIFHFKNLTKGMQIVIPNDYVNTIRKSKSAVMKVFGEFLKSREIEAFHVLAS